MPTPMDVANAASGVPAAVQNLAKRSGLALRTASARNPISASPRPRIEPSGVARDGGVLPSSTEAIGDGRAAPTPASVRPIRSASRHAERFPVRHRPPASLRPYFDVESIAG